MLLHKIVLQGWIDNDDDDDDGGGDYDDVGGDDYDDVVVAQYCKARLE